MKIGGATIHIVLEQEEDFDKLNPDLLKLSPNPASTFLNVHLNGEQGFDEVVVRNITGQTVFNSGNQEGNNRTQVDVSKWQSGMYFLSVYTAEGVITKKFEVIE
ncbi:MAG: T9SS C-terminal target domain-containing protein [Bacteroidetes bacterium]|nr:MAG: T9SS C-terminal target domain-containing protein [Bacteroidota bacterium]